MFYIFIKKSDYSLAFLALIVNDNPMLVGLLEFLPGKICYAICFTDKAIHEFQFYSNRSNDVAIQPF